MECLCTKNYIKQITSASSLNSYDILNVGASSTQTGEKTGLRENKQLSVVSWLLKLRDGIQTHDFICLFMTLWLYLFIYLAATSLSCSLRDLQLRHVESLAGACRLLVAACGIQSPKVTVKVKSLSRVQLFVTPWTVAYQAPPSMGFFRHNTGVGCHFLLQGIFPTQGSNLGLPHWRQTL